MLNKTIWLLWLQGWDNAPWLVKEVAKSWQLNNPDWKIRLLTNQNIKFYINDIDYIYDKNKNISEQAKSDIIRLSLLKNHGGVWVDATMLCLQPINFWIEEAVSSAGIFMYHNPEGFQASWFIVAQKNNPLIKKWKMACDMYWSHTNSADKYLWMDELFKQLYIDDIEFRNYWNNVPYLNCDADGQPHMLVLNNEMTQNSPSIKFKLYNTPPYIVKLCWKQWLRYFPDINQNNCKNSNGYFAIQMSKRQVNFNHHMTIKNYNHSRF